MRVWFRDVTKEHKAKQSYNGESHSAQSGHPRNAGIVYPNPQRMLHCAVKLQYSWETGSDLYSTVGAHCPTTKIFEHETVNN